MTAYLKFLIIMAIVAIIGIPVFVLDFSNLAWSNNRESYWGMIAMVALIGAILLNNRSQKLAQKLKDMEK